MTTANDQGLQDFLRQSKRLGADYQQGKDSLPILAIATAEAARNGYLSDVKDADGHDDVARAYIAFSKEATKKAVHEPTPGGLKANISKLRAIKLAAEKPTCDFVNTLQRIIDKRRDMVAAGDKVKSAYPTFVDAARMQSSQDDDLTDEQVESVIRPKETDPSIAKELAAIEKRMEALAEGTKGVKYDDADFVEALDKVKACSASL